MRTQLAIEFPTDPEPRFTKAVIGADLLRSPFVLIDVGVNGGVAPRWKHMRSALELHGFDPLEEVIAPLRSDGQHYYTMAIGNEDGERQIFVSADTYSSSFYAQSAPTAGGGPAACVEVRTVPIRRLDSLVADGAFSRADFIKADTEGFEPEVFKGAKGLLDGVLAVDVETNFNTSPTLPESHFWAVYKHLLPDFTVQDVAFNRIPRANFARAGGIETIARPATFNILFAREPRSQDETLRLALIFELYGMRDTAYDLALAHREASRLAYHLIVNPLGPRTSGKALASRYFRGALRRLGLGFLLG